MLKNRVQRFLEVLRLPKSRFAACVGISTSALTRWLDGNLQLSQNTQNRIDKFLIQFNS